MAAVAFFLTHRLMSAKPINLPPGPPGLPILGNLLQLGAKPNESLAALCEKYGPLMTLRLGFRTTIVVSSPEMAKEVLKTQDHIFAGRTVPHANDALSQSEASIVFGQQGPHWRMLRRVSTTQLFIPKKLDALQSLRKQKVDEMLRDLMNEKTVDVGRSVLRCSVNLIGNLVFGRDMFAQNSEELKEFKDVTWEILVVHALPNLADFFPFLRPLDPQGLHRRSAKAFGRLYEMLDALINKNLSRNADSAQDNLLSALLNAGDEGLDRKKILAYLAELFVAGTDTVATTVEWAMAELIKNPELLRRAQKELYDVVGRQRSLEEEDAERLPYLRAVVKETFRFHSTVPFSIPHRADEQTEVCGYTVPKHSQVLINTWAIGRDPRVWKNAEVFDPERFMECNIDYRGQHFELIPFGSGRRICVGMSLGIKMVHLILGSLIHCFNWSLPHGYELDMSDKFGVTLRKANPLLLHPSPRLPQHVTCATT
eukprot:TRINITY_DN69_c0_g1_i1.p1 TRINITY_DN69_c0_g1~~TRINITY_DN69_c0_g1_i1.p1  ORF type:complete len:541 (-),score=22.67 TRINITY_DN69_c0_g1_i1:651-2099(-)